MSNVPLGRKTLIHEWRRFAPAALAVAFSGLLVLVQVGLVVGMFATLTVYITESEGELWVGFPGTQSLDQARNIGEGVSVFLLMHPDVERAEPMLWTGGDWRGDPEVGSVGVILTGIRTRGAPVVFGRAVTEAQRRLLEVPGAILVDEADLEKLGVAVGDTAEINGRRVRVVGLTRGLRALGGVNVIASLETVRYLDPSASDFTAYYVVKLRPGADPLRVKQDLTPPASLRRFEVWTAAEFADMTIAYWLLESGAGIGVLFSSLIGLVVGIVITSQTLSAAVAGSIREYATLRALGVGFGRLRATVLAQASWLGVAGLILAAGMAAGTIWLARENFVPMALETDYVLVSAALVLAVAWGSGLLALGQLRKADPASLLR